MKFIFSLAFLLFASSLFAQKPYHFLIKNQGTVQIQNADYIGMNEQMMENLDQSAKQIKKVAKEKKNKERSETAYLAAFQEMMKDPTNNLPAYIFGIKCIQAYISSSEVALFPMFSFNQIFSNEFGQPDAEIVISDVKIQDDSVSLRIEVHCNQQTRSMHYSLPNELPEISYSYEAALFGYWDIFIELTHAINWITETISELNPSIITLAQLQQKRNQALLNMEVMSPQYLADGISKAKKILKPIPYQIPFDQTVGVLISKDEKSIWLLTQTTDTIINTDWESYQYDSSLNSIDLKVNDTVIQQDINFLRFNNSQDKWTLFTGLWGELSSNGIELSSNGIEIENNTDQIQKRKQDFLLSFYSKAFDFSLNPPIYTEELWVEYGTNEIVGDNVFSFADYLFEHIPGNPIHQALIQTYIKPLLDEYTQEANSEYCNYYQRTNAISYDITYTTSDILISNPEQTIFIYPVLLAHKNGHSEPSSDSEDFKFYVLMKNAAGTFDVYDWHYFKNFPYQYYYSLLACANTHLGKISNWSEGSEIIDDAAFWSNFVTKQSERGYEYLTELTMLDQSPRIEKAEFEAQVQDCIDILSQYDVKDLYPAQLKQIVLCLNTIQVFNLKEAKAIELATLSKQLHFKERLNRRSTPFNNYYPSLHLEFENDLKAHSYYEF
jgi:hypothetical protein